MEMINSEIPKSRLSELSEKAQEQGESAAFMEPGEKTKKKPGRPPGSSKKEGKKIGHAAEGDGKKPPEPQAQTIPTAQVVKPLVNLISVGGVAFAEDERARMRPEELEAGAQVLGLVLDKYMPDLINKYGPEIACVMVFGQYGLRVYALKKLNDIDKAKKQNAQAHVPQGDTMKMPESVMAQ